MASEREQLKVVRMSVRCASLQLHGDFLSETAARQWVQHICNNLMLDRAFMAGATDISIIRIR